jgi:predicted N-formylglutamate amidohydrolase
MNSELIAGGNGSVLVVADHSSAAVPPGIDLGVADAVMQLHIAIDIGVDAVSRAVGRALDCPVFLARWSRLVADCNRAPDDPGLAPAISDGVAIPGNTALDASALALRQAIHADYHAALAGQIARQPPALILSVHSFTPALASRATARPWPVGILWNRDDRAAVPAIAALQAMAINVGVNEPYSGRELNYCMDRHAEDAGIPSIGFEIRQDEIADAAGVALWAARIAAITRTVQAAL